MRDYFFLTYQPGSLSTGVLDTGFASGGREYAQVLRILGGSARGFLVAGDGWKLPDYPLLGESVTARVASNENEILFTPCING